MMNLFTHASLHQMRCLRIKICIAGCLKQNSSRYKPFENSGKCQFSTPLHRQHHTFLLFFYFSRALRNYDYFCFPCCITTRWLCKPTAHPPRCLINAQENCEYHTARKIGFVRLLRLSQGAWNLPSMVIWVFRNVNIAFLAGNIDDDYVTSWAQTSRAKLNRS